MNKEDIEIFEKRDFGEFISAPISFFAQEFKLLTKVLLMFVGPFIVLEAILIHYFGFSDSSQIFSSIFDEYGIYQEPSKFPLLVRLVELFHSVMLYTTIGAYVKLYSQRGRGNFEVLDIWQTVGKFFWPVMGGQVLGGIMIVAGTLALIIPGIYLGVVISLLFFVIIYEEQGVGNSISRVFKVIKGNWWTTFGVFIVMGIMFIIMTSLLELIVGGIFSILGYGRVISASSAVVSGLIYLLVSSILTLLPIFLYSSFVTEKEDPVLMDRINKIIDETQDVNVFELNKNDDKQVNEDNNIEKWNELLDDEEKKNRFNEGDDDTDRFKPKH